MSHSCKALLLHCIDFRFGVPIKKYLEEQNLLGNCDIVSIAGAAKNIVSPAAPSDREFILRQIDIAKRLHNIQEVILMNHTDCGAYGGHAAFESREEERVKHKEDMASAAKMIGEKYPDLNIRAMLADIDDSGKIAFAAY